MDLNSLIDELNDFNNHSYNKIRLAINKNYDDELYNRGAFRNNLPFVIPRNNNYEYVFQILNKEGYTEHSITANREELVNSAFKLSKLICNEFNLRLQIHYLILDNCYCIIERHKDLSKEWTKYLMDWDIYSQLSVYKSYSEAVNAEDRFIHSLKDKIKKYLEEYNPSVLEKIKLLNKQIKNNNKEFQDLYR